MTLHLNSVPSSALVKLTKTSFSELDKVLLPPAFVQVMFGCGFPVASQRSAVLSPSMMDVLDGDLTISGTSSR